MTFMQGTPPLAAELTRAAASHQNRGGGSVGGGASTPESNRESNEHVVGWCRLTL
jgi:hypothetical protein